MQVTYSSDIYGGCNDQERPLTLRNSGSRTYLIRGNNDCSLPGIKLLFALRPGEVQGVSVQILSQSSLVYGLHQDGVRITLPECRHGCLNCHFVFFKYGQCLGLPHTDYGQTRSRRIAGSFRDSFAQGGQKVAEHPCEALDEER